MLIYKYYDSGDDDLLRMMYKMFAYKDLYIGFGEKKNKTAEEFKQGFRKYKNLEINDIKKNKNIKIYGHLEVRDSHQVSPRVVRKIKSRTNC